MLRPASSSQPALQSPNWNGLIGPPAPSQDERTAEPGSQNACPLPFFLGISMRYLSSTISGFSVTSDSTTIPSGVSWLACQIRWLPSLTSGSLTNAPSPPRMTKKGSLSAFSSDDVSVSDESPQEFDL